MTSRWIAQNLDLFLLACLGLQFAISWAVVKLIGGRQAKSRGMEEGPRRGVLLTGLGSV